MHVVGDMFEPENKFIEVTNIYKTEENCLPLPFPPPALLKQEGTKLRTKEVPCGNFIFYIININK